MVWIQDDAAVALDDAGTPLYFQGFMADATVRKQNELKLREIEDRQLERERAQNERLRSVDRMKDEFVALVSHELRTPLTSIRGYLELVMDEAEHLPAETREYLEIVGRNADRLLHLVGDLLLVAQAEAGKLAFDWAAVELVSLASPLRSGGAACSGGGRRRAALHLGGFRADCRRPCADRTAARQSRLERDQVHPSRWARRCSCRRHRRAPPSSRSATPASG